jgi:hypothetical protein
MGDQKLLYSGLTVGASVLICIILKNYERKLSSNVVNGLCVLVVLGAILVITLVLPNLGDQENFYEEDEMSDISSISENFDNHNEELNNALVNQGNDYVANRPGNHNPGDGVEDYPGGKVRNCPAAGFASIDSMPEKGSSDDDGIITDPNYDNPMVRFGTHEQENEISKNLELDPALGFVSGLSEDTDLNKYNKNSPRNYNILRPTQENDKSIYNNYYGGMIPEEDTGRQGTFNAQESCKQTKHKDAKVARPSKDAVSIKKPDIRQLNAKAFNMDNNNKYFVRVSLNNNLDLSNDKSVDQWIVDAANYIANNGETDLVKVLNVVLDRWNNIDRNMEYTIEELVRRLRPATITQLSYFSSGRVDVGLNTANNLMNNNPDLSLNNAQNIVANRNEEYEKQTKVLKSLGIQVRRKPNNRPIKRNSILVKKPSNFQRDSAPREPDGGDLGAFEEPFQDFSSSNFEHFDAQSLLPEDSSNVNELNILDAPKYENFTDEGFKVRDIRDISSGSLMPLSNKGPVSNLSARYGGSEHFEECQDLTGASVLRGPVTPCVEKFEQCQPLTGGAALRGAAMPCEDKDISNSFVV